MEFPSVFLFALKLPCTYQESKGGKDMKNNKQARRDVFYNQIQLYIFAAMSLGLFIPGMPVVMKIPYFVLLITFFINCFLR